MFVRFRERPNDARRPFAQGATQLCTGRCQGRDGRRIPGGWRMGKGCPERPRCRWRVDGAVPYRLLVSLIETRREAGKVRQEHVSDLGSISCVWLPGFYPNTDEASAAAHTIVARLAFWNGLEQRLARLANRLDDAKAALVRDSVQERVPQPTADDISQVEIWRWVSVREGWQGLVDRDQRDIERWQRHIAAAREDIAAAQPVIGEIEHNTKVVRQSLEQGNAEIVEQAAELRYKAHQLLGEILAERSGFAQIVRELSARTSA